MPLLNFPCDCLVYFLFSSIKFGTYGSCVLGSSVASGSKKEVRSYRTTARYNLQLSKLSFEPVRMSTLDQKEIIENSLAVLSSTSSKTKRTTRWCGVV